MPGSTIISIGLAAQAAVALGVGLFAWRRRRVPATPAFVAALLSIAWWSLCEAMVASGVGESDGAFWENASYFGIVTLPPAFLVLALQITRRGVPISRSTLVALAIVPLATLWSLYSNDTHHLFAHGGMGRASSNPAQPWEPGPLFWVHTAYSYVATGLALILIARAVFVEAGVFSRQMALVLVSATVPLFANIFRVVAPAGIGAPVDPTPLAFLVSVILLPFAMGGLRFLDVAPGDRVAAFADSPEALLVLDARGRITAANERAAQLLDLRPASILGESLEAILPLSRATPDTPEGSTAEIFYKRGNDQRVIGYKVSETTRRGGQVDRVVSLRDDTRRIQVLRAAEIQYQELFDEHPLAILVYEPTTLRIVHANKAAVMCYKWTLEQLQGLSVAELWASEDHAALEAYAAHSGAITSPQPARHRRRDGSKFDAELRSRLTAFAGAPAAILTVEDITGRLEMQRQAERFNAFVAATASLWRSTVDSLQTPLLVLDASDRIFDLNQAAGSILALDLPGAIGMEFQHFDQTDLCRASLELARVARRTGVGARRLFTDGATGRSYDVRSNPVMANEGQAVSRVVILVLETTEMMRLEKRAAHEAEFARLGALVAAVAHDVRGPLAGMTANMDALEIESSGDERIHAALEPLHQSVARINALMQALLDYGRPAGEQLADGDLASAAMAAVAARRTEAAGAGVVVETAMTPGLSVQMERPRVQQAIENLIANAIHHSPRGSVVRVETSRFEAEGTGLARVSVADRGPGFKLAEIPRVLEPFYSRRRGGTGLGLAIANRVAEQHGGRVIVANAVGGGALVTLEMPLV